MAGAVSAQERADYRAALRGFFAQRCSEAAVRAQMATEAGFDRAVWQELADLGVPGLVVPEELGGAGAEFADLLVAIEEMGRSLACLPAMSTAVLATHILLLSGDENAAKEHLPAIAAGQRTATLAYQDGSGRWGEAAALPEARRADTGWQLSGSLSFVLDGHTADLVLVVARTDAGLSVLAVEGDASGVERIPMTTVDQTRKQAVIHLTDAPAVLVGTDGDGARLLDDVLDLAAVALAAEQVGGAERCLEMSLEYVKIREQFGRPIGSFQAIKHTCADVFVSVAAARSAAEWAATCSATPGPEFRAAASMAKAYCSEAYEAVATETVHVHGGIGFTWEHPAHLYFKRAKTTKVLGGDPDHHHERLLQTLGI